MRYILDRLREPSTYAGLAPILLLVGVNLTPDQNQAIIEALMAAAGLAAVFLPERD